MAIRLLDEDDYNTLVQMIEESSVGDEVSDLKSDLTNTYFQWLAIGTKATN